MKCTWKWWTVNGSFSAMLRKASGRRRNVGNERRFAPSYRLAVDGYRLLGN